MGRLRAREVVGFVALCAMASGAGVGCFGSNSPGTPDSGMSFGPIDGGGGCPAGWYVGSGGKCFISLMGSWTGSTDSNTNGPDTVATLGTNTQASASVVQSHTGSPGGDC